MDLENWCQDHTNTFLHRLGQETQHQNSQSQHKLAIRSQHRETYKYNNHTIQFALSPGEDQQLTVKTLRVFPQITFNHETIIGKVPFIDLYKS